MHILICVRSNRRQYSSMAKRSLQTWWRHTNIFPPRCFVAAAMDLTMVPTTQWHREFIAHLAAERWALREAQVVSVRWQAAADQTRLLGNEPDVIAVADSSRLGEGKHALVNSFGAPLPSAAWGNARRSWVHTLRSCCPVVHSRRRCRPSVICGQCRQSNSKRVLDAASVVYDEFAFFGEPPVRPGRGVIA